MHNAFIDKAAELLSDASAVAHDIQEKAQEVVHDLQGSSFDYLHRLSLIFILYRKSN